MMYNPQLDTFLRVAEAKKSMYGDTKRIIQDCNEAVARAKNAIQDICMPDIGLI